MSKILIVDDDSVLARLYKSAFENEGHEVDMSFNGEEAWPKVKEFKPDLVLSDIMMPRVNGLELLKEIKKDKSTKAIPVVVMTNLKDEENEAIALKEGAVKILGKNEHDLREIVEMIKELLPKKA